MVLENEKGMGWGSDYLLRVWMQGAQDEEDGAAVIYGGGGGRRRRGWRGGRGRGRGTRWQVISYRRGRRGGSRRGK